MDAVTLTANAIQDIQRDKNPENPVLQVLAIKKIPNNSDASKPDRYRLHLSDGVFKHPSAMLATQLNDLISENKIEKNGIVRVTKYICNTVSNRRIVIILGVDIISGDIGHQIGDPQAIKDDEDTPAPVTAVMPAPAMTPDPAASTFATSAGVPPMPAPARAAPAPSYHSAVAPAKPPTAFGAVNMPPGGAAAGGQPQCVPIQALNPYRQRWCIRARLVKKSPKKEWTNQKGSGTLFSIDLLDESGEIRATAFTEQVIKFYDMLVEGKVYYFKGGRIRPANRKFTTIKHEYELSFDSTTEIWEAQVSDSEVPRQTFTFVPIKNIETLTPDSSLDIIAVVMDISPTATIQSKAKGTDMTKRDVVLMDETAVKISCTLWGADAEKFETNGGALGAILAIKSARISDYSGRSLSVSFNSTMMINPDIPEAHRLSGWYNTTGKTVTATSLTTKSAGAGGVDRRILLEQIKNENVGMTPGKADYFVTKAMVVYTRKSDNMLYKGCPTCNKKLLPLTDDQYMCEKCRTTSGDFKYKMMLGLNVADATGQAWLTCFEETATKVLGQSAQELGTLKDQNQTRFEAVINQTNFNQFMFKCRAKTETYQEQDTVKIVCLDVYPIDPVNEAKHLIAKIKAYGAA